MNAHDAALMAAPSITSVYCAVCGAPATDQHHVVPRSRGGHHGPTIALCGFGNTGGCHGAAHAHRLHFRWEAATSSWHYLRTEPMKYHDALEVEAWKRL